MTSARPIEYYVHARGFVFPGGRQALTDPAEYNTWAGVSYDLWRFKQMLDDGQLPNGLLIQLERSGEFGPLGVIVPDAKGQRVETL